MKKKKNVAATVIGLTTKMLMALDGALSMIEKRLVIKYVF